MAEYTTPVNQFLKSIDLQPYDRYLPNAFNDSLTMLEKVNKVIQHMNETNQLTNEVVTKWNDFVKWVNTDGIDLTIDEKMNKIISNDKLKELIDKELMDGFKNEIINDHALKFTNISNQINELSKFTSDWVNLESLGGKGDGIFDNTNILQNALDQYETVYIPSGKFRINGTVSINKSVSITGGGYDSILMIKGKMITDTNPDHSLKLFNFRIENHLIIGNAIEVIKNNTTSPKNALDISHVCFYTNNNISSSLTSTILYIKGVREASILNCLFIGDSSAYGTGIKFVGDINHMTMNITINSCNFYYIGTFIDLETDYNNMIYLAGFRLLNNMYIGCNYGIKAKHVDYLQISNSMFDFTNNPIYAESTHLIVTFNYIQTRLNQCIYLINSKSNELRSCNISNNFLWSTSINKVVHGIVFDGGIGKIEYSIISNNQCNHFDKALFLKNVWNTKVNDNFAYDTKIFIDGNNDSKILELYNNYAETNPSVEVFFQQIDPSCIKGQGNKHGVKMSNRVGRFIDNGTGEKTVFTIPHNLISTPISVSTSIGHIDLFDTPYIVTYDPTNITITFKIPPKVGVGNVIVSWRAEI